MSDILTPEVGQAWSHRRTGDAFRVTEVDAERDVVHIEYIGEADYPRNNGSLESFREAVRESDIERAKSFDSSRAHD